MTEQPHNPERSFQELVGIELYKGYLQAIDGPGATVTDEDVRDFIAKVKNSRGDRLLPEGDPLAKYATGGIINIDRSPLWKAIDAVGPNAYWNLDTTVANPAIAPTAEQIYATMRGLLDGAPKPDAFYAPEPLTEAEYNELRQRYMATVSGPTAAAKRITVVSEGHFHPGRPDNDGTFEAPSNATASRKDHGASPSQDQPGTGEHSGLSDGERAKVPWPCAIIAVLTGAGAIVLAALLVTLAAALGAFS